MPTHVLSVLNTCPHTHTRHKQNFEMWGENLGLAIM
ncbi:hypothetical protein SLEP1_g35878 [Rubroshorea leprosula]|uniref:Uncharacterized protein n=1 Tax=Rubroshorea leprosula TaxID=152421 RepID=A0AAV5KPT3_9ROSI|nr:hypothetical protein SLEP1_g35878 [Rubroshorea leprosula]